MRSRFCVAAGATILVASISAGQIAASGGNSTQQPQAVASITTLTSGRQAVEFTQNLGQWDERVLFRTQSGSATIWITKDGVCYQFTRRVADDQARAGAPGRRGPAEPSRGHGLGLAGGLNREPDAVEELVSRTVFAGANDEPVVQGLDRLGHTCNYFLGSDPSKWRTDVPNYAGVVVKGVYPGIDIRYWGNVQGELWCEWIAAPGADHARIKVEYEGATESPLVTQGSSSVRTAWGHTIESMSADPGEPVLLSPQAAGDVQGDIEVTAPMAGSARLANVGLLYSTYLGGSLEEAGQSIAVDASGNAYVAGWTQSSNYPTQSPYQGTRQGPGDLMVTKLASDGSGLIYSTFLGGSGSDLGFGIAVDAGGSAYVTGDTYSSDFPTLSAIQTSFQGIQDAVVVRLSSAGNALLYSTYLGGSDEDRGWAIAVDGSSNAYVTGYTLSADFPVQSAYQSVFADSADVFVTKIPGAGGSLVYSTYIGGISFDAGQGIAVDASGNAYVAGWTDGTGFPTQSAYETAFQGVMDAIVLKLSSSGSSLTYSTYLGGADLEWANAIAVDGSGNAYITGQTESTDFPTQNPFQAAHSYQGVQDGWYDVFVTKLSTSGSALEYSTYLGGEFDVDFGHGIAVDGSGSAIVAGRTNGFQFPTLNAFRDTNPDTVCTFVTMFSGAGNTLEYSTLVGTGTHDWGFGVAVDGSGDVYVTGQTSGINFPTVNAFQSTFQGGTTDAFAQKLRYCPSDNDGDLVCDNLDNCPATANSGQEDLNFNGIGDACEVGEPLTFDLYSPVYMVVTDPTGDSISPAFNTIGLGSTYDTTQDLNSPDLSGPDGNLDDRVTIPEPLEGNYQVRLIPEPGAPPGAHFTLAIRINGNQQLVPDEYRDATVAQLGTTISDRYIWVASTTLTGDFNGDGSYTSSDIILLVNFVFKSGPPPNPLLVGDVNCSGSITSADLIQLVNHVFKGGPPPCSGSGG